MTLKEIGGIVKAELVKRNMTQKSLADELGVNQYVISHIVNGHNRGGKHIYDKVAKYLDIEFEMSFPIDEGRDKV